MAKIGLFLQNNMSGKKIELYVGDQADWMSYADNDTMSYVLIVGTFKDYDAASGVITLISETSMEFYVSEDKIDMFWLAGQKFNIRDTTTTTIKSGKSRIAKNRDIL